MEKIKIYVENGIEVSNSGIDESKFELVLGLPRVYDSHERPFILAIKASRALDVLFDVQNSRSRATAIAFIDSEPSRAYGTIYLRHAIYVLVAKSVGEAIRSMKNKSWWDCDPGNFMDDFNKGGD